MNIYNVKFTFGLLEDNTMEREQNEGEAKKVDKSWYFLILASLCTEKY